MRTKRYVTPRDPRRRNGPVIVTRRPNPDLWARALAMAGGDPSRLTVDPDGSITVHNTPPRRRSTT